MVWFMLGDASLFMLCPKRDTAHSGKRVKSQNLNLNHYIKLENIFSLNREPEQSEDKKIVVLQVLPLSQWNIGLPAKTENRKLWFPLRVSGCPYGRFPTDLLGVASLLTTSTSISSTLYCLPWATFHWPLAGSFEASDTVILIGK